MMYIFFYGESNITNTTRNSGRCRSKVTTMYLHHGHIWSIGPFYMYTRNSHDTNKPHEFIDRNHIFSRSV